MINSTANAKIKNLVSLQKKGKARREQDVFVAEGMKMYQEAPRKMILQTFVSETFYHKYAQILTGPDVYIVSDRVFAWASDTKTPQGILCLLKQSHYRPDDLLTVRRPLLLILEDLQDPGNLGTIMRTAEGAGVTGLILSKDTVDIYNPKTIRATMGSIYRMPFYYSEDLPALIPSLKVQDITVYAADLEGQTCYDQQNYQTGTAFLIGNEGNGLSAELTAAADQYIRIPMGGRVESLNAAVASAILMYEAARQRR